MEDKGSKCEIKIGVLALQGAFQEHIQAIKDLFASDVCVIPVRNQDQLNSVDGLIIPGGESTSMGIIANKSNLIQPLRTFINNKPTWGTCAGMIMLADRVLHQKEGGQFIFGGMDITVDRNYFGSQVQSFETDLRVSQLGEEPVHAIFIRAPVVVQVGPKVEILAQLSEKEIVAVQQGALLATAFHPELSAERRWHKYFVEIVKAAKFKT